MEKLCRATKTILFAFLLIQALAEAGIAQEVKPVSASQTREEALIKSAYMNLMLYNRAAKGVLAEGIKTRADPSASLQFEISAIRTGSLEEIQRMSFGELVTQPTGSVIRLDRETYETTDGASHIMYHATWTIGQTPVEDWKSITVAEMLSRDYVRFSDVGKYASYEVLLRFQGKERSYRAIALFHEPLQLVSTPKLELFDAVVGIDHMNNLVQEDRMPVISPWDKYVKSRLYARYAQAVQTGERGVETNFAANCPSGYEYQTEARWAGWCCDHTSLHCCLPSADAGEASCCGLLQAPSVEGGESDDGDSRRAAELYEAADCGGVFDDGGDDGGGARCVDRRIDFQPIADSSDHYQNDHVTGEHRAYAAFRGFCKYDADCTVRCRVKWYDEADPSHETIEWGLTGLYNHIVTTDIKTRTEDGIQKSFGQPGEIVCGKGFAVSWKYCLVPWCVGNVKLTWTGQGFESESTEWNKWDHVHSERCPLAPPQ